MIVISENKLYCANRSKNHIHVYIKYQKAYKPIYFLNILLYNEIMNKCDFQFMFSSWQCGES